MNLGRALIAAQWLTMACFPNAFVAAATYTFTGAAGTPNWSNASNWQDGVLPQSGVDSAIVLNVPASSPVRVAQNDLTGDFDIGGLYLASGGTSGNAIRVHDLVLVNVQPITNYSRSMPIEPVGSVSVQASQPVPAPLPGQVSGYASSIGPLRGSGSVTFGLGVWGVGLGDFQGTLNVPAKAVLRSAGSVSFGKLNASGILDFGDATVRAPSNATLDLSTATLDLGRSDGTAGTPGSAVAAFQSDVRLGTWVIGGDPIGSPNDRIDVTGTLDLRASNAVAGIYAQVDGPPVVFPLGGLGVPPSTVMVLATYGNRLGTLNIDHLSGYSLSGIGPSYPIVYTSGENAGPGQILVLIPEPSTLLVGAAVTLLAVRRRPQ